MKQQNNPLVISDTMSLPLEAVTRKLAFIGGTGGGKSYAATKLAEEMHTQGAQIVVLDPFAGSATTGMEAVRLNRNAILIDKDPTNKAIMERYLDVQPEIVA